MLPLRLTRCLLFSFGKTLDVLITEVASCAQVCVWVCVSVFVFVCSCRLLWELTTSFKCTNLVVWLPLITSP